MLRDEIAKYTELSGNDGEHTAIGIIGAYLDGYEKGLESRENMRGEWIPVSERLPEDHELVLFSTKTDKVFEGRYFDDSTDHQWYAFRDGMFVWNNFVTAWQPLPEPYKKGGE